MTNLTLEAMSGTDTVFGTTVSDLQSGITVADGAITGSLTYYNDATSALVTDWGAGNFMAIKFNADDWSNYTSVLVGLDPSESSGLVELINDPDKAGVFKITDKGEQVLKIVLSDGVSTVTQEFDLSGLTVAGA